MDAGRANCDTWGTGPLGTLYDGCGSGSTGDHAELATVVVLTILVALSVGLSVGRLANRLAGSVLVATSAFHVVWGEGDMNVVTYEADHGDLEHAVVLAAINTREITVTATTAALVGAVSFFGEVSWLARGLLMVYTGWAGLCAWAATSTWSHAGATIAWFDISGVALGVVVFLEGAPPK